jgi:hypothetical protein
MMDKKFRSTWTRARPTTPAPTLGVSMPVRAPEPPPRALTPAIAPEIASRTFSERSVRELEQMMAQGTISIAEIMHQRPTIPQVTSREKSHSLASIAPSPRQMFGGSFTIADQSDPGRSFQQQQQQQQQQPLLRLPTLEQRQGSNLVKRPFTQSTCFHDLLFCFLLIGLKSLFQWPTTTTTPTSRLLVAPMEPLLPVTRPVASPLTLPAYAPAQLSPQESACYHLDPRPIPSQPSEQHLVRYREQITLRIHFLKHWQYFSTRFFVEY